MNYKDIWTSLYYNNIHSFVSIHHHARCFPASCKFYSSRRAWPFLMTFIKSALLSVAYLSSKPLFSPFSSTLYSCRKVTAAQTMMLFIPWRLEVLSQYGLYCSLSSLLPSAALLCCEVWIFNKNAAWILIKLSLYRSLSGEALSCEAVGGRVESKRQLLLKIKVE